MIKILRRIDKKEKVKKIDSIVDNCWIRCINPTPEEIESLSRKFKLRSDLILDGLDVYENPRVEQEKGNVYIFLRTPIATNPTQLKLDQDSSESFLLILTKKNTITIGKTELSILNMLEGSKNLFTNNRSLITLLILSYISKMFSNSIREIMKTVKKDKANISHYNEKDLFRLVVKEDTINDYLSSFSPLIDINKQIIGIKELRFTENEKELIKDLAIDLNQTLNTSKGALKNISNMRDYYTATLTNRLNKTITLLTFFTVFLTIPTIVFSMYGMNVSLPSQYDDHILEIIFGGIILSWGILYIFLKKLRML